MACGGILPLQSCTQEYVLECNHSVILRHHFAADAQTGRFASNNGGLMRVPQYG
jgi:hypothetical protein